MRPPRLSPRLRALLDLVPEGLAVADIGSGHGAVAHALAARGQRVVATERTPRTLGGLVADLARLPGGAAIAARARLGDGLAALAPGEVEAVVIAGMGGRSIVRILDSAPWLPRWLVLQPVQEPGAVEAWIAARGWEAVETPIAERRRRYRAWRVRTR
ncbi:MAG: tRNA (adenine22-N1)-methyltransferase [Chloroflexota bacterium]|nr:tRNA (adenine22-N1)-methyltransferase [Chloroflexota bacterium]